MRLRQRHLLVGGQQLHAPDRAQVEPQRVEARLDRQVDLRLSSAPGSPPGRVGRALVIAAIAARSSLRDDLDAGFQEVSVEVADLLLRDLDLLETGGDLLERQVAALASLGDQPRAAPRPRESAPRRSSKSMLLHPSCLILLRQPASRPCRTPAPPTGAVGLVTAIGASVRRPRVLPRGAEPLGGSYCEVQASSRLGHSTTFVRFALSSARRYRRRVGMTDLATSSAATSRRAGPRPT